VSRELRRDHDEVIVHTGQHYDEELSAVFFDELGLPAPDYNLGVGSASHTQQTTQMMLELEQVVERESPDAMLVYGDTNSTLAGALVAAKRDFPLAHVEAGLRSYNRSMPEEINRVLTDHAADLLFAPSETALSTLEEEGITNGAYNTGDVMYDAILWARETAPEVSDILDELGLQQNEYVVATIHRAGNTDDPNRLEAIIDALAAIGSPVIFPAHPRTVDRLDSFSLRDRTAEAVTLINPVGYFDFVMLLDNAATVVTDSGGVQKEAFFVDTACVTVRPETEWVETVEAGWNKLVDADMTAIDDAMFNEVPSTEKPQPYGDGKAAERIVSKLNAWSS
jgi:UDP-N-acetylglucosamine 2-epimerase (non-hydrolysing)